LHKPYPAFEDAKARHIQT